MNVKRFLALVTLVVATIAGATPPASAQTGPSVLRVSRGLTSNNVFVNVNRAIVLESTQPFAEVSVAQPAIADVAALSNQTLYILGKAPGVTTLTILGEGGRLITNVEIRVGPDLSEFKDRLATLIPGEQIEVRTAGSGLVLSGTVSGKGRVDRAMALARQYAGDSVTNMMTVGGTQQVLLKVRIAEMSRSAVKDLGINLAGFINTGSVSAGAVSGGDSTLTIGPPASTSTVVSDVFSQLGVFSTIGSLSLGISIDALEQRGFARMLAEPNLVALSGNEARFLAGGEFPVPVIGDEGDISISFKPIGVSLNFVPIVLDDDLINLTLSAEVSAVDPTVSISTGGVSIPSFSVRRAETTVELRDGYSFAIAGLLQDDFTDTVSQVPWLGDIPVLGTLFRSVDYQRGQTELVVIVTAHLVTPVSESELAIPTDRVRIPNESELFLFGTDSVPVGIGEAVGQGFDGDFGYVVE